MAVRTHAQLARRRRIETGIRVAAPVLDLVLFAGDQLSRVAGRRELSEPAPPALPSAAVARRARRLAAGPRG